MGVIGPPMFYARFDAVAGMIPLQDVLYIQDVYVSESAMVKMDKASSEKLQCTHDAWSISHQQLAVGHCVVKYSIQCKPTAYTRLFHEKVTWGGTSVVACFNPEQKPSFHNQNDMFRSSAQHDATLNSTTLMSW